MTKTTFWTVFGTAVGLLVCCSCLGASWMFEAPGYLLVGWAIYPFRLIAETSPDWPALGIAAVCVTLLTLGLHAFCRWFYATRKPQQTWPWRWTFGLVGILMLAFVAGITAIGVTHETYWMATSKEPLAQGGRHTIDRVVSGNNMRQIGTGVHNYHGVFNHVPLGGSYDAQGRAMHSWQTFLLPYMEQQPLFNRIDFKQPWNAPGNADALKVEIQVYLHPSITQQQADGFGLSHYAGNVHVLGPGKLTFMDITDGLGETILAGEVSTNFKPWGYPANWRDTALGIHKSPDGFGGPSKKVTLFLMADASVRGFTPNVSPTVLKALATPNGGEQVPDAELSR